MGKTKKRILVIGDVEYFWTLKDNFISGSKTHIKVYKTEETKSILFIDPYDWHFVLRPKAIRKAILFGLSNGWIPGTKKQELYIAMKDDEFYVLPEGITFFDQIRNE